MRLLRFVVARRDVDSSVESGPFGAAYRVRDSVDVDPADREALAAHLAWFDANLERPSRFNRTKSKGFYRRNTRGIAWFRDTATEHVARMHQIAAILERHGHPVTLLSEARVGYVIWEDEFQVIAEPFSDTQTR